MRFSFLRILQWSAIALVLAALVGLNYDFDSEAGKTMNAPVEDALSQGLLGYWKMDEGAGTSTTADSSGNANNLTMTAMESGDWVAGQIGAYSLDFDGSAEWLTVADPASGILDVTDGRDFTITGWFNRDTFTTDDTIVAKRNGIANTDDGYILYIDDATDQLIFEVSEAGGTDEYQVASTSTFTATGWNHFAAVWDDGNATQTEIYINGKADNGTDTGTIANLGDLSNAVAFRIGAESDNGNPFDGKIDDVRIYSSALPTNEISRLYQTTVPGNPVDTGLVGHWTFDGNDVNWGDTGLEIKDVSGKGNHGAVSGLTRTSVTPGKLGQGLSFDGTGDYVSAPAINFNGAQIITVSFWLFMSAYINNGAPVIALGDSLFSDGAFSLRPNGDTVFNAWEVFIYDGDSRFETFERPSVGEWHHFSFILDNSTVAGDMRVFVDGSEVATTVEWASKTTSGAFRTDTLNMMTQPAVGDYLAGRLDDVRIYSRALTQGEITNLYVAGR